MPASIPASYLVHGDGHRWGADTGAAVGSPVTITYSFPTQQSSNLNPPLPNWATFNPTQIAAAREALDYIESFTNITFQEVSANTGKLQFDNADLGEGIGGTAPHAVYGGQGGIPFAHVVMNNKPGWRLDNDSYIPGDIDPDDVGGGAWQTLIHELAHTLGIKHPHDVNDAGDAASVMPADIDNLTRTTMSYRQYGPSKVAAEIVNPDGTTAGYAIGSLKPETFGMDDIAALQYLYGVKTGSTGNNTYSFQSDKPIYMTISDEGPNNTIDVSTLTGQNTIYMHGGSFSDLSIKQTLPQGFVLEDAYDGTRALAIGYRAQVHNVIGGSGVDRVSGNALANNLYGKNGDDQLIGGDGADHLYGGIGADRLVGDAGFDFARYDDANYGNLVISLANPALNTGAAKGDTYESIEGVIGGFENDTITGDAVNNTLRGGRGNDILNGGAGADTLDGETGNDTFFVDNAGDRVIEGHNSGFDTVRASVNYVLTAGQQIELLTTTNDAGTAAIRLTGNELANTVRGNAGANVISGGRGADELVGLLGDDIYYVDNAGDAVIEARNGGLDTVLASVHYTLTAGQEIERLYAGDVAATNTRTLTGNEFANAIRGNAGVNYIDGGAGADALYGLGGNDFYTVDNVGDRVIEAVGGGVDTVYASVNYTLVAGQEVERLYTSDDAGTAALRLTGNELANLIKGNAGANVLNGGAGADSLYGLAGNDIYHVDNAGDRAIETVGNGTDTVLASVDHALSAGQSIEQLYTVNQAATTALKLTGNEIANTIRGNAGANVLDGKADADILTGLGGQDTFAFSTALAGSIDRITDFAVVDDTIQLSRSIFTGLSAGVLAETAFKDVVLSGGVIDSSDRIIYDRSVGALFFDRDGSGFAAAVQFATLDNKAALTHADFFVV